MIQELIRRFSHQQHKTNFTARWLTGLALVVSLQASAWAVTPEEYTCEDRPMETLAELQLPAGCDYRLEDMARVSAEGDPKAPPAAPPPALEVVLRRTCCTDQCTFGQIEIDGEVFCRTMELPWNDNRQNVSCIPEGTYQCGVVNSPSFTPKLGTVYEVKKVKGRSHILIHTGNKPSHTEGCILVGVEIDVDANRIRRSKEAYDKLIKRLNGCPFKLKIIDETKPKTP